MPPIPHSKITPVICTDMTFQVAEAIDDLITRLLEEMPPEIKSGIYYYIIVVVVATMFKRLEPKDQGLSLDARLSVFKEEVLEFSEQYKNKELN
jgi:hypothetical protein